MSSQSTLAITVPVVFLGFDGSRYYIISNDSKCRLDATIRNLYDAVKFVERVWERASVRLL